MSNRKNLSIREIKAEIKSKELDAIYNLIKGENFKSILSHLSENIIKKYLKIIVKYKDSYVYVLEKKNSVIGYAIYFKKERDIIKNFNSLKFEIVSNLLLRLKIFVLLNIFLAKTKLDLRLLNTKIEKKKNYLNLNLLAIRKEYQSRGYGNYLINHSVKKIKKNNIRINKIICEAPSERVLKFYLKNDFKIIGKKLRMFNNFYILQKQI